MKHYIVIEVREPRRSRSERLDAGRLRKAIHRAAKELGISCGDVIVREDLPRTYAGHRQPYAGAAEVYRLATKR